LALNLGRQTVFLQQAQVELIVLIGKKHLAPTIAPLGDMVRNGRDNNTSKTSHGRKFRGA
jgi:hypothetical protein